MVPWEFRICETTAGIAVEGSRELQIAVIPWSGFSGKDMWLEERRVWCKRGRGEGKGKGKGVMLSAPYHHSRDVI